MADKKQLARLKKSVNAWNKWREKNFDEKIDLRRADLKAADLFDANLINANLRRATLSKANLIEANLSGADLVNAELTKADLTKAKLKGTNLTRAYLMGADLIQAQLSEADLTSAYLTKADLSRAILTMIRLSGAHLSGARLSDANLIGADLREADLSRTDLNRANLSGADLSGANLRWANLSESFLNGANLNGALVGNTLFDNTYLSQVNGLETVRHQRPSTIGIDTIYKSKGNIPEVFLRGAGVPENLIAFMHSLTGKALDFYSCFISHSAKDKSFCERLYADLQAKGVRTWYFPEDAKWGETVWGEIDRGIKIYDKLVIVLSENSLQSKPVLREVQRSLDREDKEHKNILFPICIDDYIFDKWEHERKADVLEKVVGDFSGWDKYAAKYQKAFDKLLKGLQAESDAIH